MSYRPSQWSKYGAYNITQEANHHEVTSFGPPFRAFIQGRREAQMTLTIGMRHDGPALVRVFDSPPWPCIEMLPPFAIQGRYWLAEVGYWLRVSTDFTFLTHDERAIEVEYRSVSGKPPGLLPQDRLDHLAFLVHLRAKYDPTQAFVYMVLGRAAQEQARGRLD